MSTPPKRPSKPSTPATGLFAQGGAAAEALENIEAAVHGFEEQVRDVNARIDQKAGRPLWQAIVIGLLLGGVFLGSLLWLVELFVVFVTGLVVVAVFELATALRTKGRLRSRWPLVALSGAMIPVAFYFGPEGQLWAFLGAIVLVAASRAVRPLFDRPSLASTLPDIGVAIMVLGYVPFLAGFAVAIAALPGGQWWVLAGVVVVVAVDTGAYVTGLSFGRTPLAPKISPKKTWEGFAGSSVAAVISGALLGTLMLGLPLWVGLLLGALLLGSATLGDLVESLIKRDLDIKDISSWLPGHGGFLDRLDSMLPSMAMLYVMVQIFG
jgi:phosphatidate cytidylyltransferase